MASHPCWSSNLCSHRAVPLALAAALLLFPAVALPEEAPAAEKPQSLEGFRQELVDFFRDPERYAPTVLAALAENEEFETEMQRRIAQLSIEELTELKEQFDGVPDWRMAAEILMSALPEEARQQVRTPAGSDEGRAVRNEVGTLFALARMLPESRLVEAGTSRAELASQQQLLATLPLPQTGALLTQLASSADWQQGRDSLLSSLPEPVVAAAEMLAEHGPLADSEISETEAYRADLLGLLSSLDTLPAEIWSRLDHSEVLRARDLISQATPEMIFALSHQVDRRTVRDAGRRVAMAASLYALDEADRLELEEFRGTLGGLFLELAGIAGTGHDQAGIDDSVGALSTEELYMVRQWLRQAPDFSRTLPRVTSVLFDREVLDRLQAIEDGLLGGEELAALRSEMVAMVEELRAQAGIDAGQAERVLEAIRSGNASQLTLMREVQAHAPVDASPQQQLDLQSAAAVIGPPILVGPPQTRGFFDDIGQTLSDGFNSFFSDPGGFIGGAVDSLFGGGSFLSGVGSIIQPILDGVGSLLTPVLDAIGSLLDQLIQLLRDLVEDAIGVDLLDPATWTALLEAGNDVLGSFFPADNFPLLPCPADGTVLAFFGEVGTSEAADRHAQYSFILGKVLELVPDTEPSLILKIPSVLLTAVGEHLGVCLQEAAAARDAAATDAYRTNVLAQFVATQAQIAAHDANLTARADSIDQQITDLRAENLRHDIEQLLAEPGSVGGSFQVPQALGGHLELVAEIVGDVLDTLEAGGISIGNARQHFEAAEAALVAGDYPKAWNFYGKAFRQALGAQQK